MAETTIGDLVREQVEAELAKIREEAEAAKAKDEEAAKIAAAGGMPRIPEIDHAPETPEEVADLAKMFAAFRKEVADLRAALDRQKPRQASAAVTETLEDRTNARLEQIAQHSHYCPGCGQLYDYPQKCKGFDESPHKPIEVVSTDELGGDPADHTAAPATEVDSRYAPVAA
jgi:hypothetical protein